MLKRLFISRDERGRLHLHMNRHNGSGAVYEYVNAGADEWFQFFEPVQIRVDQPSDHFAISPDIARQIEAGEVINVPAFRG